MRAVSLRTNDPRTAARRLRKLADEIESGRRVIYLHDEGRFTVSGVLDPFGLGSLYESKENSDMSVYVLVGPLRRVPRARRRRK